MPTHLTNRFPQSAARRHPPCNHRAGRQCPGHPGIRRTRAWQVVERRELDIAGEFVTLSPDGQWIAGIGLDGAFCVWEVATEATTCDAEPLLIDDISIRWSPDSSAVAFSLDTYSSLEDSDVFVFELEAGQSANLTEDGIEGPLWRGEAREGSSIPVDLFPAWSADSTLLTFIRSDIPAQTEFFTTELLTMPREGGEPERRFAIRDQGPLSIGSPLFNLRNGSLLFSINMFDGSDPDSGIWLLDANGDLEQLLPGTDTDAFPHALIRGFVETGSTSMVVGYGVVPQDSGRPSTFLLNVGTGEVDPIEGVSVQGFSPDGESTIGWEMDVENPRLLLTDENGIVTDLGSTEGLSRGVFRGYDWAQNNTILIPNHNVPDNDGGGVLITVRRANDATPVAGE